MHQCKLLLFCRTNDGHKLPSTTPLHCIKVTKSSCNYHSYKSLYKKRLTFFGWQFKAFQQEGCRMVQYQKFFCMKMWKQHNFNPHRCEKFIRLCPHCQDALHFEIGHVLIKAWNLPTLYECQRSASSCFQILICCKSWQREKCDQAVLASGFGAFS